MQHFIKIRYRQVLNEAGGILFCQQGGFYNTTILRDGAATKQGLLTLDMYVLHTSDEEELVQPC